MSFLLLFALATTSVESRIDSVIAYPDQAMVIRKALALATGSQQLVFSGLTGLLDDNSIRIRAAGLKIGEVQVKPGYSAQPTGRVKTLADSLDALSARDRAFTEEQDVLKAKEAFLNSIKLGAPELMSKELGQGRVDAGSWGTALGFLAGELTTVRQRQAELERLRKDLGLAISAVTQELANARAQSENRKTILVDVFAEQSGSYDISLSYNIPFSVAWNPYYELRANPSSLNVGITYYARLSQRTNEDWNDVKVLLSTARPSAGGAAPEPVGWYLDLYEPRSYDKPAKARVLPAPGAALVSGAFATEEAEAPAPPVETGISLQYDIPGRVSLKSGDNPKKLFLHQASLPTEFHYYAYPRISEISYLRGKVQNNSDFIFLAGQGNTYVGDEFTGHTWLASIAPGESADLSFGVDDRVKVRRELVKSLTSKSGIVGNLTKVDFVYKTTVENYHAKPIDMTLIEQIPVTQNKAIKVTLTSLDPKPDEENKDLGTSTFRLELKPQEKISINLAYSVEYPTGKSISGLY
jgi:uncharacterized protein (TIGR02231 family)